MVEGMPYRAASAWSGRAATHRISPAFGIPWTGPGMLPRIVVPLRPGPTTDSTCVSFIVTAEQRRGG